MKKRYVKRRMFGIHRQLSAFRRQEVTSFIEHSREGMGAIWKNFSKKFDETTSGWSEGDVDEYVNHVYDDMAALRDESPQLLRHAQCMIVYGTFENSLADLCRSVHTDGKVGTAPPDRLYIDDVKGYLRPHLRQRPNPFAEDWQWMHEFRIIRNWMAHAGGRTQPDANPGGNWSQAQTFVRRNRGLIQFSQLRRIIVEDGLVDRALQKAAGAIVRVEKAAAALY